VGTPRDLFDRPANVFVAEFIGSPTMNIVPATVGSSDGHPTLLLDGGGRIDLPPETALPSVGNGDAVLAGVRPEHLSDVAAPGASARIEGVVDMLEPLGSDILVTMLAGSVSITARCTDKGQFQVGSTLALHFDPDRLHLFDAKTQTRLT